MALWRIRRIDYTPEVGPAVAVVAVTMEDRDTGLMKLEGGLEPPLQYGQSVTEFLCNLEVAKGYTPNDFGVTCV